MIVYPVVDDGRVQLKALHPDNAYGPALVQTAAEADPENPAAHAAVTENVEARRTSLEIVYPTIELGLVHSTSRLHPDSVYRPALVQTVANAEPEYPAAHAAVTAKLGALRVSLDIKYPGTNPVDDGRVQSKALHPERV